MRRLLAAVAAGAALGLALATPAYATDDTKLSASAEADCGTATVTFVNNTRFNFWADVRVDGEEGHPDEATALGNIAIGPNAGKPYGDRYQDVPVPAGQTVTNTVNFGEDSGDHTVEYRIWRGPETDWYVDWKSVDVASDCEENTSPSPSPSPSASPSKTVAAAPAAQEPPAQSGGKAASLPVTGSPVQTLAIVGGGVVVGGVLAVLVGWLMRRRRFVA